MTLYKEDYKSISEFDDRGNTVNGKVQCPFCKKGIRINRGELIYRNSIGKCTECEKEIVIKIDYSITLNLDIEIKKVV